MTTAYPLAWPEGWPRTAATARNDGHQFKQGRDSFGDNPTRRTPVTLDRARKLLFDEMERLGATGVVLSTNITLRSDGMPRADYGRLRLDDPGAALYFTHNKRQIVMAQDAFNNVAANVRSLGLAIEAMRALERHGGGSMMERAFTGFAALPAPERPWHVVLGFTPEELKSGIMKIDIESQYRRKAARIHADNGGDAALRELNLAKDQALASIRTP